MGELVGGNTPQPLKTRFQLCSLLLISTPSFIQIGQKLAKLVLWSGLGGLGEGGKGVEVVGSKKFLWF